MTISNATIRIMLVVYNLLLTIERTSLNIFMASIAISHYPNCMQICLPVYNSLEVKRPWITPQSGKFVLDH
jgi:hypothetical protein